MGVLSSGINRICDANPGNGFCGLLYGGSILVMVLMALVLPFVIYSSIKSAEFRKSHWTTILAILSGLIFFYLLVGGGVWALINNKLDESVDWIFIPLVGVIPYMLRTYAQEKGLFKDKNAEEDLLARSNCGLIEETLSSFGVEVSVVEIMINPGQFVYKLRLEENYRRKEIAEFSDDLGMRLKSKTGSVGWSDENCAKNEVLLILPV